MTPSRPVAVEKTKELMLLLVSLEDNRAFQDFMTYLQKRAEGLALWGSYIPEESQMRWVQGRVQELSELLHAWMQRHEYIEAFTGEVEPHEG